jgi:rRNA maturation endonuclease Nob1
MPGQELNVENGEIVSEQSYEWTLYCPACEAAELPPQFNYCPWCGEVLPTSDDDEDEGDA